MHRQEYHLGEPVAPLAVVGPASKRGTMIRFKPSAQIFTNIEFDYDMLAKRLRELSFLNSGVRIELIDEREDKRRRVPARGRHLRRSCSYLNRTQDRDASNRVLVRGRRTASCVEVALQWNDSYQESMYCYTNNIPQKDGGTHLAGFRAALTRTLNDYIEKESSAKKEKVPTTGDDAREGLTAILSVKLPDPKFSSQTKDKLVSSEVKGVVEAVVSRSSSEFLLEHPHEAKAIVAQDHRGRARARSGAQGARDDASQGRARYRRPARQARRLPGKGSGAVARSSSSRAIRQAARPSRAATGAPRRSCRSRARS